MKKEKKNIRYTNPVVRGFYPDPSACRVGDDFYLVNSTFEYLPGVPVFHSKDLVHWKQIGHCISRPEQLKMYTGGRQSASGIFAPSIRYRDGIFYMVTTNVMGADEDKGNFYVWTKDPEGEWSDPVFLGTPGIDPSFFFDDDGQDYYVGTCNRGIYIAKIDFSAGKIVGEQKVLWHGTGGSYPEGPHLYKKNGFYYLMISEGGTERSHMITMARSKSLEGPFEECPYNPVLTNRSLKRSIESIGHADMVEDQHGNWWAVCLGTRTFSYPPKHNLGRETMLVPVDFSGDWPVFGNNGTVDEIMEVETLPAVTGEERKKENYQCDFSDTKLDLCWNYLYNPELSCYQIGGGALKLLGNQHNIGDKVPYTWLGRRQCEHETKSSVTIQFPAVQQDEEAGFSVFMNHRHHYEAAILCEDGERKIIFRRQIGSLKKIETEILLEGDTVTFEIESDLINYTFYYQLPGEERKVLGQGEINYLTTEVGGSFTGNYYAMYAMGNGKTSKTWAVFTDFSYREI